MGLKTRWWVNLVIWVCKAFCVGFRGIICLVNEVQGEHQTTNDHIADWRPWSHTTINNWLEIGVLVHIFKKTLNWPILDKLALPSYTTNISTKTLISNFGYHVHKNKGFTVLGEGNDGDSNSVLNVSE